ncbi:MAG TPA: VWA domain-containing protein, partial [Planctomycetaceae bacterium]|nr:VWA domain-containing protein [Planctomycetaceae bacterium]
PGYYEYSARIEVAPEDDSRSENNEVRNDLYLEGPGRILVVRDPEDQPKEWEAIVRAVKQGERQVDVINALEFPYDPRALLPYDAVIFANVAADSMLGTQIEALHDAIKNLGVGFMMVGGPNSFGPGGWQGSAIDKALPISMEITNKKILPKGALAIILHTCEFPQGNSWAKRITKKAIQVLNSEDLVGAMAQTMNGDEWIFELTPASKYAELVPLINNASIGDMGTFGTTMQLGFDALVKCDAASRHMIIISDGDASPPTPELLGKFIENQISVSTVAVFPHSGDTAILEEIAGVTGGRFYYPSDPNQLPSIFIKEAKTLRRSQLQLRDFVPSRVNTDPMLKDITESPQLHGYVLTSPKEDPRATILLAAPPSESEIAAGDTEADPILAVWRYGLGVTAAFTSDLNDRWGKDWVTWNQYQQLLTQIVTRISRTRREEYLRVYTYVNGNEGVIVVEDFHPTETLLDIEVKVTGPNSFDQKQPVRQIAPRRYQTSMPLKGEGRYQVMIGATDGSRKETAYAGLIVSYSPEYLRFSGNPIVLKDIWTKTGGKALSSDMDESEIQEILFGDRKPKRNSRPIFDWYLMLFACLLPL